jgi:hypothetical protein
MFPLRAVIPDGFGVIDQDCVCRSLRCLCHHGLETREEASDRGVDVIDGDTGLVKSRLDNGVVLNAG